MAAARALLLLSALCAQAAQAAQAYYVHLALSSDPTKMFVQWRTDDAASAATVSWGASPGSLAHSATGTAWAFTDGGRTYNLRRATMSGLTPGALTFYTVGDSAAVYNFSATRSEFAAPAKPLTIAWFGDLGWQNAQALPYLVSEAAAGAFDHYIHVGGLSAPPQGPTSASSPCPRPYPFPFSSPPPPPHTPHTRRLRLRPPLAGWPSGRLVPAVHPAHHLFQRVHGLRGQVRVERSAR